MKTIYAISRVENQKNFYKFFERKESAEQELKEIAKTYLEKDVKWKDGDLLALNDIWHIDEICVY